jgi:hypothetical protein
MTIERDQKYWAERYELYGQCCFEDQRILKALKRVDRARGKLIEAQNNLAMVVTEANDITRKGFAAFYKGGGVTAEDWEEELNTGKYQNADKANKIARGQLRLIHSKKEGERKVRPPQTFDNGGPEAA